MVTMVWVSGARYRDRVGRLELGVLGAAVLSTVLCEPMFLDGTVWHMQSETAIRFRVTPKMRGLLDRHRDGEDINVSAWVRRHIENALRGQVPEEFQQQQNRTEKTGGEMPEL